MSAFVLNRKYELALPTSYVDVDNEEMEYVDGGVYISNGTLKAALVSAGVFGAINIPAIQTACYLVAGTLATSVPGLGWLTGGLLCAYSGAFAVNAFYAIREGKGVNIRLSFPWGLSFSVQ